MPYKYIWRIDFEDESKRQPFIKNWHDASEVLQEYPGARGTRLNEVVGETALVAIAEWESKEARGFMLVDSRAGESERSQRWQKFPKNGEFGTVTPLAEIDEVDAVMPA
jgi:hypothetical protein